MAKRRSLPLVSLAWFNPYTSPPADVPVLEDGRTRWAATLLDRSAEAEVRAHMPPFTPGDGWTIAWCLVHLDPPLTWSAEAKGRVRRHHLRKRLEAKVPLFADQFEAAEIGRRPAYFRGE